jgi:hypothetical protein
MLGEILGQESGKLTGMRVLPSDGPGPKMESSFQANARIVGLDGTDTGTYWAVVQPDGSLFGDGQGVLMTADGGMATWRGQGVGRLTGRGSAVNWRGAIYYQTASRQLARLNGVAAVYEFNVDENGNTQAQIWEWK